MDREHTLVQTPSQGELTEEYGALSWSITAEDSGPEDSDNEQLNEQVIIFTVRKLFEKSNSRNKIRFLNSHDCN